MLHRLQAGSLLFFAEAGKYGDFGTIKSMDFKKLRLAAVLLAFLPAACSSPETQILPKRVHLASQQTYYVPAGQFRTVPFPPPPAPGSDEQKGDLAAVMAWQEKRTAEDCAKAAVSAAATYEFFWGNNSPFDPPFPEEVERFLGRLTLDLDGAVTEMKDRYRRQRPYKAYPGEARPCIKKSRGYSYPSGHSVFSRVFAGVLADIVPGRKDEFLAKADTIALDRVIGGVHFPADIAAGKEFGDLYHAELLKSEAYRADIEKMKTYLAK